MEKAKIYLVAAWGIAVGALFLRFWGQLNFWSATGSDPGGVFPMWLVLLAKGLALAFMVLGLRKSIRAVE
jgi:hypothetical protein